MRFEGGSFRNGTINYDNTYIEGRYNIQCVCKGVVANDIVDPRMYGARGDGKTDDAHAIQQAINCNKQMLFHRATYLIGNPIVFDRQNFIVDFNFATLRKTNVKGIDYKYDNTDFNKIPCLILIKPYQSNTSGHIILKNLILDGGKTNVGIHAIWCRNVILDNVRIYSATQGFVYKGFTNTFRDITIWDSKEGFVVTGGNATLFERCFSSQCGWNIKDVKGLTLTACSSDDYNPCYDIRNSIVTMVGCTFESKGIGLVADNSVIEMSGDYETHIYDSTRELTYVKAVNNSVINAKSCNFRLSNYLKKKVPDSNLFEVAGGSEIRMEGRIDHGNVVRVKKASNSVMTINGKSVSNGSFPIK